MPYVADQIAYDLARRRAAIACQEPLEPLIGIKCVARVHGLGYPVGVKQEAIPRAENHACRCIGTLLHKSQSSSAGVFQRTHSAAMKVIGQVVAAVTIVDLTGANI